MHRYTRGYRTGMTYITFDDCSVLCYENNWNCRKIKESLYIQDCRNYRMLNEQKEAKVLYLFNIPYTFKTQ